jgi:hypothetical protein
MRFLVFLQKLLEKESCLSVGDGNLMECWTRPEWNVRSRPGSETNLSTEVELCRKPYS